MTSPEIGLSMLFCLGEPFSTMTKLVSDAKITYIEIVDEGYHSLNKKRVSKLKDLQNSYGLRYTVHAPFAGINIGISSKPLLNAMLKRLKRSIMNASDLGCKTWIFHPGLKTGISMFYPKSDWIRNLESVRTLYKYVRDHGMDAAVENVSGPFIVRKIEGFKKFFHELHEDVGLTLDIGHANIEGQLDGFLTEFSDRLVHIHAHDNYGKKDQHLGIGCGNVDWKRVASLLKRIRYHKIVTIESVENIKKSMQKMRSILF